MENFLISGFLLSLIFNFLWILSIIHSEMKTFTKIFFSFTLIVACTFIFAGMFYLENKQWNNGYCINCGTKYQAIGYEKGATIYECPNCYYNTSR